MSELPDENVTVDRVMSRWAEVADAVLDCRLPRAIREQGMRLLLKKMWAEAGMDFKQAFEAAIAGELREPA